MARKGLLMLNSLLEKIFTKTHSGLVVEISPFCSFKMMKNSNFLNLILIIPIPYKLLAKRSFGNGTELSLLS